MNQSADQPTTLHLVRSAQAGDREALEDLATRYLPRVRQIVTLRFGQRMRREGEVDDYVQESLIRVLGSLGSFEEQSEGTFRNWLARCVEREVIDQARKNNSQKRGGGKVLRFADCGTSVLHSSIFAGSEPAPSRLAHAQELADQIEDALLEMPEHQRELVILRTLCGMTYTEVAGELGIPTEGAARVACSRALKHLKERLGMS